MALIKGSALVDKISGSVGATVFAITKSGNIARSSPRMIRHTSERATRAKAATQRAIKEFSQLTDAQYLNWQTGAANRSFTNRLGVRRTMTTRQLAFYAAIPAFYENEPFSWSGPPAYLGHTAGIPTIHFTVGGPYNITLTDAVPAFSYFQCLASRSFRTFRTSTFRNWKSLGVYFYHPTTPADVSNALDAAFGPPVLNERIGLRIRAASAAFSGEIAPIFCQTKMLAP